MWSWRRETATQIRRTLAQAGFRPAGGGEHVGRGTANELARFRHGYLEWLSVVNEDQAFAHGDSRAQAAEFLRDHPVGLLGYALEVSDLDAALEYLRRAGVEVTGPHPMARIQPDGRAVGWRTALIEDRQWLSPYPFLIQWDDDEERRWDGAPTEHSNTVVGVSRLTLTTRDLAATANVYSALGAEPVVESAAELDLDLGPLRIELRLQVGDLDQPGRLTMVFLAGTDVGTFARELRRGPIGSSLALELGRAQRWRPCAGTATDHPVGEDSDCIGTLAAVVLSAPGPRVMVNPVSPYTSEIKGVRKQKKIQGR